jgi:hypothetical protein
VFSYIFTWGKPGRGGYTEGEANRLWAEGSTGCDCDTSSCRGP